jgi:hypothetical protein
METWARLSGDGACSTQNTNLAAALGTLGVKIRTQRTLDVLSKRSGEIVGDSRLTYFLTAPDAKEGVKDSEDTKHVRRLIKDLRSGELERELPEHPLIVCLAALHNRERILDWLKQGTRMRLAVNPGGVMTYVAGEEPEFMKRTPVHEQSGTRDLKMVAALGVLGIPLLRFEGLVGSRTFWVATQGHWLDGRRAHADELVRGLKDGSLESENPEHRLLYAWQALLNRERLLDHLNREMELIQIRAPGTRRAAFVREDASGTAHDKALGHLEHGTPG